MLRESPGITWRQILTLQHRITRRVSLVREWFEFYLKIIQYSNCTISTASSLLKCLEEVNSLIVPEIGQMEHKRYLIWLVISCIDFFHRDAISDKMTALHKSA